ncbi:hypothetical protein BDR26DRAFT_946977 [Obelidium mucronatum]|nr:hypothetical protein BDR26DRAFT_946977 [Obelidium mucronatum]
MDCPTVTCPDCPQVLSQCQEILEELNTYRKLLRLPPKTLCQPTTTNPNQRDRHCVETRDLPAAPTLQTLPAETIDQIFTYIKSGPIFPICHSLRQLKHVSESIYLVGNAFPEYYQGSAELLWPDFHFPCRTILEVELEELSISSEETEAQTSDTEMLTDIHSNIPMAQVFNVYNLTGLISRYKGAGIIVPCSPTHLDNIIPLLPKIIEIKISKHRHELHKFLTKLTEAKDVSCIRMLHIPDFRPQMDVDEMEKVALVIPKLNIARLGIKIMYPCIAEALPKMQKLIEIQMQSPTLALFDRLPCCASLKVLTFVDANPWNEESWRIVEAALLESRVEIVQFLSSAKRWFDTQYLRRSGRWKCSSPKTGLKGNLCGDSWSRIR